MDSKIKTLAICSFAVLAFLLTGCKQNNWMDWKTQNELWLLNNASKDSVQTTHTGLQYKVIADPGADNGEAVPNYTSTVEFDYTVKLINGYQVDGGHARMYLPNTIPGFAEGCRKIHTHGDIELYIPSTLGYDYEKYTNNSFYEAEGMGTEGTQTYIPPYSTLIYKVHLCDVYDTQQ